MVPALSSKSRSNFSPNISSCHKTISYPMNSKLSSLNNLLRVEWEL